MTLKELIIPSINTDDFLKNFCLTVRRNIDGLNEDDSVKIVEFMDRDQFYEFEKRMVCEIARNGSSGKFYQRTADDENLTYLITCLR